MLIFQIKVTIFSSGESSTINETVQVQDMMYRFVSEIAEVIVRMSE